MSWQAFLFNSAMRLIKRQMNNRMTQQPATDAILSIRKLTNREMRVKLPDRVTIDVVEIAGCKLELVAAANAQSARQIVLYFHGGAFVAGAPLTHRNFAWHLSAASGHKVALLDYRLAPEHCFPAPIDDAVETYRWLLAQGYAPADIAIGGDSAGGNLTLTTILKLKELGLPLPYCAICLSPWADLTHSGKAIIENAKRDAVVPLNLLTAAASAYAPAQNLKNPLISPAFADLRGFPPIYINAGSEEILVDDARRIADNATRVDVAAICHVWPKMQHAFTVATQFLPEARSAVEDIAGFMRLHHNQR
jgi:monoterpene epsilon-lactone hydrolase